MDTAESRLAKTLFIVEANRFEQQSLWERYAYSTMSRGDFIWEQMDGWLVTVGKLHGRPICIDVFWNKIEGQLVMFWHPTSALVDHKMIDNWLDENFHGTYNKGLRRASCDAQNFHQCISAIKEKNTLDAAE